MNSLARIGFAAASALVVGTMAVCAADASICNSGAGQLLAGMKGTSVIVAINRDEEAPTYSRHCRN